MKIFLIVMIFLLGVCTVMAGLHDGVRYRVYLTSDVSFIPGLEESVV